MSTFQGSLRIKPLRKSNALLYEALFNESFYSVPNALTMDTQQLQHIQNDSSCSAGFLMEGGMPIGVFELQYDDPIPEIAALAINVDLQGQGYGRRALATLEQRLRSEGFSCAKLLVSSLNQRAIRLYCSAGYLQNQHLSRWYQTACMSL
ncbi:MAG: GNAT family N-acetyltransferase [Clostridia bacterium]